MKQGLGISIRTNILALKTFRKQKKRVPGVPLSPSPPQSALDHAFDTVDIPTLLSTLSHHYGIVDSSILNDPRSIIPL